MRKLISFIYLLLLFFTGCLSNNKGFIINGRIKDAPEGAQIFLANDNSGIIEDSTIVQEGLYTFKGRTPYPQRYNIIYRSSGEKHNHYVWVENIRIEISGVWDKMDNPAIIGGKEQNLYQESKKQISFFYPEYNQIIKEKKYDSLNILMKRLTDSLVVFSMKNANSFMGIEQLYRIRNEISKEILSNIIMETDTVIKSSPYGKSLLLHCESPTLDSGAIYHDFAASTLTGDIVKISSLLEKEKPVLIIFGGLGCMGKNGRALLKEFYEKHGNEIEIAAFVFARNRDEWLNDAKYNLGISLLSDMLGDHSPVKIKYGVQITPTVFLISKNGEIVLKSPGYNPDVNDAAIKLLRK